MILLQWLQKAGCIVVLTSYVATSFAQTTYSISGVNRTPKTKSSHMSLLNGCMQRLTTTSSKVEYQSLNGTKLSWRSDGEKITSVSNGKATASARYENGKPSEVVFSNGRVVKLRAKLTAEERADLPAKIKRLKKHVGRVLMRECNIGVMSAIQPRMMKAGDEEIDDDYPDDWDDSWGSEEFWQEYYEDDFDLYDFWAYQGTLPRRSCVIVGAACNELCESSEDFGNLGCAAAGGALALAFPVAGLLYGLACATGVLILTNNCKTECGEPEIVCNDD